MTVIRQYFNNLSDEELIGIFRQSGRCFEKCPIVNECEEENYNNEPYISCIKMLEKYGLKEVEE